MTVRGPTCAGMMALCLATIAASEYAPVVRACQSQERLEQVRAAEQAASAAGQSSPDGDDDQEDQRPEALVQPYCTLDRNVRAHLPADVPRLVTPVRSCWSVPHHPPRCEVAREAPSAEAILAVGGLLRSLTPHAPPGAPA